MTLENLRPAPPDGVRAACSRAALGIGLALIAATFLLISPSPEASYPGAIPWRPLSLLKSVTEAMSLGGLWASPRGVEIKDFALHLAAVAGMALLAARWWMTTRRERTQVSWQAPWLAAQILLLAWVALECASTLWSGDPPSARGQALAYAFWLGLAVALGWTLERRDVRRLLDGIVALSALGGALCVWYFTERNPNHRPGFPIGNPGPLAAMMLPAVFICLARLADAGEAWLTRGDEAARRGALQAFLRAAALPAAALVPLGWCFWLADARAAQLGLVAGAATAVTLALSRSPRGRRWAWGVGGAAVGGALLFLAFNYAGRVDVTMARGATVRFRLYAWRYAAELWSQRPVLGHGAGAYPRLAGQFALQDRALDPGAFMGEIVEHAHNELFEILAEIGLVGGVTIVAGLLGTLAAATRLGGRDAAPRERWAMVGLSAALVALLTDSLFGVGMRLPGVPAMACTLVGAVWAAARVTERDRLALAGALRQAGLPTSPGERQSPANLALRGLAAPLWRGAAIVALVLSAAGAWVAIDNWRAVLHEARGLRAAAAGEHESAVALLASAERDLLDPVRRLSCAQQLLRSRTEQARAAAAACLTARRASAATQPAPASAPAAEPVETACATAILRAGKAYDAAEALNRRAPKSMYAAGLGARAAEMLASVYSADDAAAAQRWAERAEQAWHVQRQWTPHDLDTLLALTNYRGTLAHHVGLLRDALRSTVALGRWQDALRRLAAAPGFDETLDEFVAAAGPTDPQSDVDWLVVSRAPEVYRLAAAARALRGEFDRAAELAGRAADLYGPLRSRFPELHSVALAEQAYYLMSGEPGQPIRSAALLRAAIAALPIVQEQKYEQMVRPYRELLILAELAAGNEPGARQALVAGGAAGDRVDAQLADAYAQLAERAVRASPDARQRARGWLKRAVELSRGHVRAWSWLAWLDVADGDVAAARRTLAQARREGVSPAAVESIVRGLCAEFPAQCEALQASP